MLLEKIASRKAKVAIIGLGYVGLPLVLSFSESGFDSLGLDIDPKKIESLKRGESYINHISSERIGKSIQNGKLRVSADFSLLKEQNCIIICVPTPLTTSREPDLTFVVNTAESIREFLKKGQLVILESTTYPGTTEEVVKTILEKSGLKAGEGFFLAYSPEREDPNNKHFTTKNIPKIVGGYTSKCLELANTLYSQVIEKTVAVSGTRVAEAAKILENIYRSVNIALVNELKMLFDRMGIDIWEVIEAASTKPFGFTPFYPGPGLGGHCIPIDPFYLTWKARQYELPTRFIELAGEINTYMPYYVVGKVMDALNDRGRSLKNARVLVLGLAYKKDVDDKRESPSLKIIELLQEKGALVDYNDPHVPSFAGMRNYPDLAMSSVTLTEESLRSYNCVVISTNHSAYDYQWIVDHSPLVIDARNATRDVTRFRERIIKA